MSIPLDRLYNFLHGVCNHDVTMYHWAVHGSKKAQNLISCPATVQSWQATTTLPQVICHDQEPLDFDLYTDSWKHAYDMLHLLQAGPKGDLFKKPEIIAFLQKYHLRGLIDLSGGVTIYDSCILLHSEKNSDQVDIYSNAGFVPVYWWSHAMIAKDWFRYAQVDPLIGKAAATDFSFLIYNRAWQGSREYRLKFTELLVQHELVQDCKMSFSTHDDGKHYTEHTMTNSNFALTNNHLEDYFQPNCSASWASAEYQATDYQSTLCEVVLETMFDHQRIHLTEKTLRPIACQQPFILLAGPGTLEYLRSYGFRTFDGIIDETYDTIQNSYDRMLAVVAEMKRIAMLSAHDKEKFAQQAKEICEFNQRWFFSNDFTDLIVSEYKQNFSQGMQTMARYKTGKMWQEFRDIAETYCPEIAKTALRQDAAEIAWVVSQFNYRDPSQSTSGADSL